MININTKEELNNALNKITIMTYLTCCITVLNTILTLAWILMMWIFTDIAHITIIK